MAILSQWYIIFFHKAFLGGIRLFIVMGVVSAVLCGYVVGGRLIPAPTARTEAEA